MSNKKGSIILQWETPSGSHMALVEVKNEDLDSSDVDYRWFELLERSSDRWETVEEISYISEVTDFGIPEDLLD